MFIPHINHKVHTPQKRTKTGLLLSPPLEKGKKTSTLNMTVPARFICKRSGVLVGGFNPSEKYARQIGSFPQVG